MEILSGASSPPQYIFLIQLVFKIDENPSWSLLPPYIYIYIYIYVLQKHHGPYQVPTIYIYIYIYIPIYIYIYIKREIYIYIYIKICIYIYIYIYIYEYKTILIAVSTHLHLSFALFRRPKEQLDKKKHAWFRSLCISPPKQFRARVRIPLGNDFMFVGVWAWGESGGVRWGGGGGGVE